MPDVLAWRKKFGVLAPSTNTIVEPDLHMMEVPGVTSHMGRIMMQNTVRDSANITANAIAPGLVATPRLKARPDFDKLEARAKTLTPLPRLADEYDVARIVLFFCSELADFITAQCLNVSGGR